jgi:hypothetical protein
MYFHLSSTIIFDCKSIFLGYFGKALWGLMDTKLKMNIAFHPQIKA